MIGDFFFQRGRLAIIGGVGPGWWPQSFFFSFGVELLPLGRDAGRRYSPIRVRRGGAYAPL